MASEIAPRARASDDFFDPDRLAGPAGEHSTFQALLAAAKAGDGEAAKELYETYVTHVLRCVRNRLWQKLRSKFDSQDFVQQVWTSFFVGQTTLPDFETPDDLIAFLIKLTTHKVVMEGRKGRGGKRDARLERPINLLSESVEEHPPTRLPTPSTVATFRERYETLIEGQQPETRDVAELRYAGHTFAEIADELQIDESNARGRMRRMKRREDANEEMNDQ